jgi:hypothetical protein
VTGRMERTERRRSEPYGFTVRHRRESKPRAVLWRHQEHRASLLRQFEGTREVVGMDMGVDHMRNRPPMLSSDLQVDAGRERWVDHRRLIPRGDNVRRTPLPHAPHLNDTHRRIRKGDLSGIPREAPCLHPARQRALERALDELFGDFTIFGGSPIVEVLPDDVSTRIYRARIAQSNDEAEKFAKSAPSELGPPPPGKAVAGRMNAGGISVFYGAFSQHVAVAEVRPRVGGLVVVARFRVTRPLRLLDFGAFAELRFRDSVFRPGYNKRVSRRSFLRTIGEEIGRPVQPHEELLDYVPTQVLSEYLRETHGVDGLIYPSAQFGGATDDEHPGAERTSNVVLFHHASRVENGSELPNAMNRELPACSLALDVDDAAHWPDHVKLVTVSSIKLVSNSVMSLVDPPHLDF